MIEFLQRIKQRKLVQWAIAYVAAAFALLQGLDIVVNRFDLPSQILRLVIVAMTAGFFVVLVLAWYHGERGAQRVSGTELLIIGLVLAVGGGLLWLVAAHSAKPETKALAASPVPAPLAPSGLIPEKSIAVLPFDNLSRDPDNAYFVEGIQDEILTRLAKISALKVISRTSTTRYTSHPDNLRQIARELGVAHILEGSVQRAEGAARVNVQLIAAETDSHLWAETYDREIKNIFSVESEIAQNVADALRAKLLPQEMARVASVPTKNPEAYDLFLKAEYFANQIYSASATNPEETARQAAVLYERAVASDPGFALAYARLSYLKGKVYWYNIDPGPEVIDAAEKAAEHALALQPELGEAHLARGFVYYWGHRDYQPALAEFDKARQSLPNNATVFGAIGFVHRRLAQMEQGLHELEHSAVLDPRDNQWPREIGLTFGYMRRYGEALRAYDRCLALFPDDFEAQVYRVMTLLWSGDLDAASSALAAVPMKIDPQGSFSVARWQLAMLRRQPDGALAALEHAPAWLLDMIPSTREPVSLLRAQALLLKGEAGPAHAAFLEAKQTLDGLLANPRVEPAAQGCLALVYAGLGQKEAALSAGQRATAELPVARDVIIGGSYLVQLAMAEARLGVKDSALKHIEEVLAIPAGHALSMSLLRLDPAWDPLRDDPRFKALLTKYATDGKPVSR